jgi:hypothetical protein
MKEADGCMQDEKDGCRSRRKARKEGNKKGWFT